MKNKTQFRSAETNLGDFINQMTHRLLSANEGAIYTGFSVGYFRKLASQGIFPRYHFSFFRFFYLKKDLDRYLSNKIEVKRNKYFSRYQGHRELIYLSKTKGRGK